MLARIVGRNREQDGKEAEDGGRRRMGDEIWKATTGVIYNEDEGVGIVDRNVLIRSRGFSGNRRMIDTLLGGCQYARSGTNDHGTV